jgi:hypothetical protein
MTEPLPSIWPEIIIRSFFVAGAASATFGKGGKPFYGPWNRLLNTLFPPNTAFEVVPQYFPATTGRDAVDCVVLLLIYLDSSPVFIVEVKDPNDFRFASKREEADLQMRQRVRDCADMLCIPVLHGVSAFGTKIAFYKYHQATRRLQPRRIIPDPDVVTDTAPSEWWSYDILEEEGANRFRDVVDEVKAMCNNSE